MLDPGFGNELPASSCYITGNEKRRYSGRGQETSPSKVDETRMNADCTGKERRRTDVICGGRGRETGPSKGFTLLFRYRG